MKLVHNMSIFASLVLLLASLASARTVDLNSDNFKDEVEKQDTLVMFFAPWCGHCKRLKPDWEILAESYAKFDVLIGSVDCDENKDLCQKHNVNGYPTILYFKHGQEAPEPYEGERSIDDLVKFVNQQTGLKVTVLKPVDPVRELDSDSFNEEIANQEKSKLVVFHASWCGHCKTLMPKLPKLAGAFLGDDTIEVVKIDANKHSEIAAKYDIQGYPTLKLFVAGGQDAIAYEEEREPEAMLRFINKHAGTQRTLDGGFDSGAWPSDEIKTLVEQFRNADEKIKKLSIVDKVQIVVASASGRFAKYARFYPILMRKSIEKPEFLNSEPVRLNKLLQNKMSDELKLNALFRITILNQLKGVIDSTLETKDDEKDDDKDIEKEKEEL